jgi:hypothetical protein
MNTPNPHHNIAHHEDGGQILADAYGCMIVAMIRAWRAQFRSPELPFVYVELCLGPIWYEVGHMAFWMAQRQATTLPAVGFATTTDIQQMVHAPNKTEVARRLVLEMNRIAHTPTVVSATNTSAPSRGPTLIAASSKRTASKVVLTFDTPSSSMAVVEGFAACDGWPYQRNSQKQCPDGGKVPTPRRPSTLCDGDIGHESPFVCDQREDGMVLSSADFYNSSRLPLPFHFDSATGTIVVDVRRCPTQRFTLNQVARYTRNRTVIGPVSGLSCSSFSATGLNEISPSSRCSLAKNLKKTLPILGPVYAGWCNRLASNAVQCVKAATLIKPKLGLLEGKYMAVKGPKGCSRGGLDIAYLQDVEGLITNHIGHCGSCRCHSFS